MNSSTDAVINPAKKWYYIILPRSMDDDAMSVNIFDIYEYTWTVCVFI